MADTYEIYNMSHTGEEIDAAVDKANAAVDKANAAVPQTRKVNGKALSADVTLSAKDVGALVKANLLDFVYPVGSIYMSVNSTSPASFLGGTWTRIQNRFLLAAGNSYPAGSTGGEATHTLTNDELPSATRGETYTSNTSVAKVYAWLSTQSGASIAYGTLSLGGGQPHNNMPPYLAVYMWKRTA